MSQLFSNAQSATYKIQKWLGINESPDGDTGLKKGEAARMVNWRITDGGAMRVRPGSENVAGLASGYASNVSGEETVFLTEEWASEFKADGYTSYNLNSVGEVTLTGSSREISAETWETNVGRYFRYGGKVYKLSRMVYTAASGDIKVNGGAVKKTDTYQDAYIYTVDNGSGYGKEASKIGHNLTASADGLSIADEVSPDPLDTEAWFSPGPCFIQTKDGKFYYYTGVWSKTYVSKYGRNFANYSCVAEAIDESKTVSDTWTWYAREVTSIANTNEDVSVRSIWSGRVGEHEILAAACNGHLWRLEMTSAGWEKTDLGEINTEGHVGLFGFSNKLYVLDGEEYRVYDGSSLEIVQGYEPCVATAVKPSGGGTEIYGRNKLTNRMYVKFSPDGNATDFVLPLTASKITSVTEYGTAKSYTFVDGNTVRFATAPDEGTSSIEVHFIADGEPDRSSVVKKTYSEFYNGTTDARVFLYGDGTNKTFYSGLDGNGQPNAEYFPDLNEAAVGEANTPITALVRHYGRLMCYKTDSAYSIYYGQVNDVRGLTIAGFYITPVNRSFGNEAMGQAVLVENRPRTLDAHAIYEWKSLSSSSGNISSDSRNAQRVSQNVESTLRGFDMEKTVCFFDKLEHEYYCVFDGTAVVQNTENGAWYLYEDFPAVSMILYKDELYYGTRTGWLRRVSDELRHDNGDPINAEWESGSIDFGEDNIRKYSLMLWVGLKPEDDAAVTIRLETERETTDAQTVTAPNSRQKPIMQRLRMKISRFNYAKLFLRASSAGKTATVTAVDVSCKYTSIVR